MSKRLYPYLAVIGIASWSAVSQAQVEVLDAPPAITGEIQGQPATDDTLTRLPVSGRLYIIAPGARIVWQNGRRADFSALTPGAKVQLRLQGSPALGVVDQITLLPE
jgi:hypothetical protein